jgi:PAS domain S-box-containing protein
MSEATAPTSVSGLIGLEARLLDRVDAAVMAVDLDGRILFANRFVEELYGWSPDELVGRSSQEFSGVSVSPELASEIMRALEARTSWEGMFEVRRKDGSLVSIHAIDSPLYDAEGHLAGVVSVGIDGTREQAVHSSLRQAEAIAVRLGQLQELSTELSRAVSVTEVAQVVRRFSMPGLETPSRGLWLLDEVADVLRLVPGDPGMVDPAYETVALNAPLPVAQVMRTSTPVFLRSIEERDRLYPELADARTSAESFAVLPLQAQHRVIGVLALGFLDRRPFDEDEVRFLIAVADQCAQALSRAILYDSERHARDRAEADRRRIHELNRALQTSLLPPSLPDVPGLDVSARYHPALAGSEVGGDFYDVFDTGGDWAAVVGDVCGKGPLAAAVTATARWTIRSVAMDVRQPAQILRKLNDTLIHQQLDDRYCTVAYARVVPTSQGVRISVCRGGHPAPLLLRANGDIEEIGPPGSLVGVFSDVRLWEETTLLCPGDAYVAYTDGVTEARRGPEQFGDERLRDTLARCTGLDADAIGESIESAVLDFGGPEPSDDLAILVLRVAEA